ncbi:hypothetical protein [Hamadaea sp.]|uniref:hypothetical protein n=1 Tax=Hamadaea sp. TaxID=2024425 RepID=UPI0025BA35A2|nr:hypothetical protein [Hamadaea sp.]
MAAPADLTGGVDVDAIAAAVSRCPGVVDLYGGSPGEVATYLPGRRVAGVRIGDTAIEVQIRTSWGSPVPEVGAVVRAAVAPLAGGRRVDVLVADLVGEPSADRAADAEANGDAVGKRPAAKGPVAKGPVGKGKGSS